MPGPNKKTAKTKTNSLLKLWGYDLTSGKQ